MPKQVTKKSPIKKVSARGKKSGSAGAHKIVLDAIASAAENFGSKNVSRDKMQTFIKMNEPLGKSTIANALTKLKKEGLVIMSPGTVTITDKGMVKANASFKPKFTTNEGYQKMLKDNLKLNARQCAVFDYLMDGKAHDKKKVAAAVGCKINSTWANTMTALKKLGIIEFGRETMNLTKDMFPCGVPDAE